MQKKGEILVENIIFIVLNLLFISILVVFLINQTSGTAALGDTYSKNIALLIDSARPGMSITVDMQNALKLAEKNGVDFSKILSIKGNYVTVDLSGKGGKSYHFFNNINVSTVRAEKDTSQKYTGYYFFSFSKKS